MAESELFERGLQARRDVLGAEYVDANLADTDEFMMAFQRVVTEWAWGYAWSRPGLDRKTRSMLNLAILTALGRPDELGIYVKGALATGVSVDEIKEILIHAGDAHGNLVAPRAGATRAYGSRRCTTTSTPNSSPAPGCAPGPAESLRTCSRARWYCPAPSRKVRSVRASAELSSMAAPGRVQTTM